ncbi:hypothetical protein F6R98_19990 [Candidatus Methylospira mobilis]|uniref:Terminase n=1 Tax=Candidatus Methylospira mobilis TaxID=1808979 RepID=A0A5Q0BL13_9GAMM|nr:hypothetical protein [Candidatus Methylospira mobilis]QFY44625.1 hypothetical protein F6R98_19990 [Candidatus Methylospira mobilis]
MAAKPKLTPEQWAAVRKRWEDDSRDGYAWLVDELALPVSGPAVRKVSLRDGWKKSGTGASEKPAPTPKVSKVSENLAKVSETIRETMPETMHEETLQNARQEVGRPTLYRKEYAEQAYKLCLLGMTDADMAVFFEVSESTINLWKIEYPEFSESITQGKGVADAAVAEALYKSATGAHFIKEDRAVSDGCGGTKIVTMEKQLPPESRAQSFWLKNRQPQQWRDKVEVNASAKLDQETLAMIETQFVARMAAAHERQRAVLIERGLLIDHDDNE